MRRLVPVLVTLLVLGAFAWTLYYLYQKSKPRPIVYQTAVPEVRDIVKKTVAAGALVPRKEVTIKPRVSGVVDKLYVTPGQHVQAHALLARIRIIPNVVQLNQAEAALRSAELNGSNALREFERATQLRNQGLLSDADFAKLELEAQLRQEEREAAEANLQLVRAGASKRTGRVSNLVYSTVAGMVLEVPVKEGGSVIEANNFNEGTTIASVADMSDMIFQGRVDESEVGSLREGMPVSILVGALGEQRFEGALEYIAPKGQDKDGTIEFEVRAAVKLKDGVFIRANYSANADIIVSRRDRVLSVNEGCVHYDGSRASVDVEIRSQEFERRPVELGLSDGIWVEVKKGLDKTTRVRQPDTPAGASPPVRK
ncbi:MAG: efflux RND transporter periplasmic adaptor subunit [Polyangiaceae bacterium]|nr:efflux RND transporter periplasmic adaptor subunit [Polyangiaceae bacterium]